MNTPFSLVVAFFIVFQCLHLSANDLHLVQGAMTEDCSNGIDDDGDGLVDCDDPDCYLQNSNECITCLGNEISFADAVIDYQPTCENELHPVVMVPEESLGAPNNDPNAGSTSDDRNATSLGEGGFIVLQFIDNVLINSGNNEADLWVFEVGVDVEPSDIELRPLDSETLNIIIAEGLADSDGDGFYEFGGIGGATSFIDLDAILPGYVIGELSFDAVKVTDVDEGQPCFNSQGADIDAVCALASRPAEQCDNGIDDDGDGFVDCDDPDLDMNCCCLDPETLDLGPDQTFCFGEEVIITAPEGFASYDWGTFGQTMTITVTESGTYSLIAIDNCENEVLDTIEINILEEIPPTALDYIICAGDTVIVNDIFYTETGSYEQILESSNGCDSLLIIDVSASPAIEGNLNEFICQGDSVTINEVSYTDPGDYQQLLTANNGCDSLLIIDLALALDTLTEIFADICEGDTYVFGDVEYIEAGLFQQTLETVNGCDSLVNLHLTVNPSYTVQENYVIESGETITINGQEYSEEGIYHQNETTTEGCDSILTINIFVNQALVHYDFEDCLATISDDENASYDEFTPDYPEPIDCGNFNASIVFRNNPTVNKHSCTPGVAESLAMCVSSSPDCDLETSLDRGIHFEIQLEPQAAPIQLTRLNFYQKAPEMFDWINGMFGVNNYPTLFSIKVSLGNSVIFEDREVATSLEWQEEFADLDILIMDAATLYVEILPYCLVGNGGLVTAFDIDEISLFGYCQNAPSGRSISGFTKSKTDASISGVEMVLNNENGERKVLSTEEGDYAFQNVSADLIHSISASKNDDILNGVTTLDLLRILQHVIGVKPLSSIESLVAADVNYDTRISVSDLGELRKVILGIHDFFPNNQSWRFYDSNYSLSKDDLGNLPNECIISKPEEDISNLNFMGIKIGDVNESLTSIDAEDLSRPRSISTINLKVKDRMLTAGKVNTVRFNFDDIKDLTGMQMSLITNELEVLSVNSSFGLDQDYYNVLSGEIRFSWFALDDLETEENWIELVVLSKELQSIDKAFRLNKSNFRNEIYTDQGTQVFEIELTNLIDDAYVSAEQMLRFTPNPADGLTEMLINSDKTDLVLLEVYSIEGKKIYSDQLELLEGENTFVLDSRTFGQKGLFTVKISGIDTHIMGRLVVLE